MTQYQKVNHTVQPHDLASLYGMGRMQSDPANVPDGYAGDDPKLGRPQDSITSRGKQDNNFW